MEVNRKLALKKWDEQFGKSVDATDFSGRKIQKGAFGQLTSTYGWTLTYIVPKAVGGTEAPENLICVHVKTASEKEQNFPSFNANDVKYKLTKESGKWEIIPSKDEDAIAEQKEKEAKAMELWTLTFGEVESATDFAGRIIQKDCYGSGREGAWKVAPYVDSKPTENKNAYIANTFTIAEALGKTAFRSNGKFFTLNKENGVYVFNEGEQKPFGGTSIDTESETTFDIIDISVDETEVTEETVVTEESTEVTEETIVTEESTDVTEETVVTEESTEVTEETVVVEESTEVTEETVVSEESTDVTEETIVTEESAEVTEEKVVTEESTEVTEEKATTEENTEVTEETVVTEENTEVTEETVVTEESTEVTEETVITEESTEVTEETVVTEESTEVTEETVITEESTEVTEEKATTEESTEVTEEKVVTEKSTEVTEEKVVTEESTEVTEEKVVTEEIKNEAKETAAEEEEQTLASPKYVSEQIDRFIAGYKSPEAEKTWLDFIVIHTLFPVGSLPETAAALTDTLSSIIKEAAGEFLTFDVSELAGEDGSRNTVLTYRFITPATADIERVFNTAMLLNTYSSLILKKFGLTLFKVYNFASVFETARISYPSLSLAEFNSDFKTFMTTVFGMTEFYGEEPPTTLYVSDSVIYNLPFLREIHNEDEPPLTDARLTEHNYVFGEIKEKLNALNQI